MANSGQGTLIGTGTRPDGERPTSRPPLVHGSYAGSEITVCGLAINALNPVTTLLSHITCKLCHETLQPCVPRTHFRNESAKPLSLTLCGLDINLGDVVVSNVEPGVTCPDCLRSMVPTVMSEPGPHYHAGGRHTLCGIDVSENPLRKTTNHVSQVNCRYCDDAIHEAIQALTQPVKPPSDYEAAALSVGALVNVKQAAYGDAFGKAGDFLRLLYPNGVQPDQMDDALTLVRMFDKMCHIATDKDAHGESLWSDICGYGILAIVRDNKR